MKETHNYVFPNQIDKAAVKFTPDYSYNQIPYCKRRKVILPLRTISYRSYIRLLCVWCYIIGRLIYTGWVIENETDAISDAFVIFCKA